MLGEAESHVMVSEHPFGPIINTVTKIFHKHHLQQDIAEEGLQDQDDHNHDVGFRL